VELATILQLARCPALAAFAGWLTAKTKPPPLSRWFSMVQTNQLLPAPLVLLIPVALRPHAILSRNLSPLLDLF
jgi:hypothetical protein